VPASAAGFGQEFCSINQKIIEIDLSSQKKNVNKLFGFDKGLFILGDYSREQRLNAVFYQKLSENKVKMIHFFVTLNFFKLFSVKKVYECNETMIQPTIISKNN